MHRRSLPIANPCHESFDAMEGDGARRFCDRCQESVHDLGAMTRAQARHFLLNNQGQKVCVRYRTASDGTLRFQPPPPRAAGPMLLVLAGLMAACTGYVEAGDLEIPDGPMCEDAAGYTIPCVDPDGSSTSDPVVDEPTPEPVVDEPMPVVDDDTMIMGQIAIDPVEAPDPEDPEGCPVQTWDDPGVDPDDGVLMGRIEPFSPREARKIEREYRRETRRARRRRRG